jgi:hypothetical protein
MWYSKQCRVLLEPHASASMSSIALPVLQISVDWRPKIPKSYVCSHQSNVNCLLNGWMASENLDLCWAGGEKKG